MLTRSKQTAIALIAALSLLGGCAFEDPDAATGDDPEIAESNAALVDRGAISIPKDLPQIEITPVEVEPPLLPNPPDDPEPTSPPARDPIVARRWGLHTLRVPVETLQDLIPFLLSGTRISIDVTRHAPPVYQGTTTVCHRDQAAYDAAQAVCLELSGSQRAQCLHQVAVAYPPVCSPVPVPHYSYVSFTDTLKNVYPGLTDKVFDLEPIHKDTWAGGITIRLNQIRSTLGIGNLDILGGNRNGKPYVGLGANVQSGQPTAYCEHDSPVLGCPDIELSNMHIVIRFEDLHPDALDTSRVTYGSVTAPFTFDRNLNNVPDWLVTPFFDVDERIRARTEQKLQSVFLDDAHHTEVAKLLTNALAWYAHQHNPSFTGFKRIDEVLYSGGEIIVHYVDNGDIMLPRIPTEVMTRD
jgi:hypothetical protein